MKPVNLFQLTRTTDLRCFAQFEQQLSRRKDILTPKCEELECLHTFVDVMLTVNGNISETIGMLNYFYFSFTIPKISKEFDLLRIAKNGVVNIELKSQADEGKIIKQLIQNKYYLKTLCRPLALFTFVRDQQCFYMLSEQNTLVPIDKIVVYNSIVGQIDCYDGNAEDLFRVSDYLISPMNTPDRFLRGEYFLSSHQEKIKKQIVDVAGCKGNQYFGITGDPGTGKTLLLYDLAVNLSIWGKCCVIHCGIMPEGLSELNNSLTNVDIVVAKRINSSFDFSPYQYVLVDESHRFRRLQYDFLIEQTQLRGIITIFSFDERQILSTREENAKIGERIKAIDGCRIYQLTNKIRTNKELASFIERLRNLHSHNIVNDYSAVTVAYAANQAEAFLVLQSFIQNGYVFINYTGSVYHSSNFDCFSSLSAGHNTHNVIGQEFDNVVMLLDQTFAYDENDVLRAKYHPNPDYLYRQLLFQGLSRVREKLAVVVLDNPDLFEKVLGILA